MRVEKFHKVSPKCMRNGSKKPIQLVRSERTSRMKSEQPYFFKPDTTSKGKKYPFDEKHAINQCLSQFTHTAGKAY